MLLIGSLLVAAAAVSCNNGVSGEELGAIQKKLEVEKAQSQSLKSELTTEQAEVARLAEAIELVEVRVVLLESVLAQERATVAASKERIDQAEAEAALLAAFLAWNRKDRDAFTANVTDAGFSGTVLSVPENLGEPSIALRHIRDTTVSGDTVTIQAMFALGTQRNSVRYSMAKQGGAWKIKAEERLSPKIKGHTTVVDVRLEGCASSNESEAVVEGNVAFKLEDVNDGRQHLILKKVPEGLDLGQLLESETTPSEGVVDVAFIAETMAGESINVAFTEALQPGRYALLCYPQGSKDAEGVQIPPEGIVATFTVK